jgi:hypothetical protein
MFGQQAYRIRRKWKSNAHIHPGRPEQIPGFCAGEYWPTVVGDHGKEWCRLQLRTGDIRAYGDYIG